MEIAQNCVQGMYDNTIMVHYSGRNVGKVYLTDLGDAGGGMESIYWGQRISLDWAEPTVQASKTDGILKYFSMDNSSRAFQGDAPLKVYLLTQMYH